MPPALFPERLSLHRRYFIGKAYDHSPDSWIQRVWTNGAAVKDHNAFERYVISMYFAFTTLTTVGFGTRPDPDARCMLGLSKSAQAT